MQAVVHSIGYTKLIAGGTCDTIHVCVENSLIVTVDGGWTLFNKYLGKHYFWNGELVC